MTRSNVNLEQLKYVCITITNIDWYFYLPSDPTEKNTGSLNVLTILQFDEDLNFV